MLLSQRSIAIETFGGEWSRSSFEEESNASKKLIECIQEGGGGGEGRGRERKAL